MSIADTGLFISMLDEGTQLDILQGRLGSFKGAIYENVMADILGKMGRKLYYFQKTDSNVYHALKLGDYNVGRNGPSLTLPFYMAFLLTEL